LNYETKTGCKNKEKERFAQSFKKDICFLKGKSPQFLKNRYLSYPNDFYPNV